jgi:DNA-binding transcriptional ArsR family regulator
VFALVVDSDADKGAAWTPTVPASLAVETSPGNAHFWFFFDRAVDLTTGQVLGERLRAATNADSDTGNVCQPYRVAGTVNYPGKKKRERGRSVTWTRSLGFDPETLWTPERLEQEFPATTNGKGAGEDGGAADEAGIPADTLRAIRNGVDGKRDRSFVFFNVMVALKRLGFTVDGIVDLLDRYPDGIAKKYEGRLRQEVERVYLKIKVDAGSDAGARKSVVMSCAEDLRTMTFNPLKYPVPGIFVEGLTVLAGKPKIGKSWFLLHAAIAVARGGFTLGNLHCIEGDVLYCALEDNARRMQSRMTKLLGISQPWPKRLTLCYDLPRLGEGGAEAIRDWILSVPNPRMVAIDTLAMIRALKKVDESNYQSDYLALIDLRALANEFGIALPVSHHLRKAEADDPFDTISGTLGLTGAVDSMLVLKRSVGGGSNYVLHGKGRDLVEIEKAMEFDRESCLWRIAGDAAPIRRSAERTAILDAIAEAGEPIGPNDIATATGMKATNVRFLLGKLVKEGVIKKAERGRYQPQT